MIGCPNCGNKLVFDIDSQKMRCKYCDSYYLISVASKWSKDAEEQKTEDSDNSMEITTFTCSQCGAEISADSDEAVTWCSFCGSPATLTSRLTRIRRPDVVVPFRKNKEACVQKYKEIARKQIYAPRDLIRHGDADGFRGIYMPYWTYDISRSGPFSFQGEQTQRYSEDTNLVIKYRIDGQLNSNYNGLSHDASQTFDDYVSERIAPYIFSSQKPFDICYLNGFYANAADQDEKVYRNSIVDDEKKLIYADAYGKYTSYGLTESSVVGDLSVLGYGTGFNENGWREYFEDPNEEVDSDLEAIQQAKTRKKFSLKSKLAMFPVWFMSYRWGDRVSYATMNGDTGKMYAEFPASPKRFLLFSAITAIPLFFLIYALYTLTPPYVLFLALMASLCASGMFRKEVIEIFRKQFHVTTGDDPYKEPTKSSIFWKICLGGLLLLMPKIELWWNTNFTLEFRYLYLATAVIALVIFVYRFFNMRNTYGGIVDVHMDATNLWYAITALLAGIIYLINPASDIVYYSLAFALVAVVCLSVTELIRSYNVLASVRPKQFNRSGGEDDNA